MAIYIFGYFISFLLNALLFVPFINMLYQLRFQRADQKTVDAFNKRTPIFDSFHKHKAGTPVGGGMLIVFTTVFLFSFYLFLYVVLDKTIVSNYALIGSEIKILLFTFIAFALLGLYDDLKKIFTWKKESFFGLRLRHKLFIEIALACVASYWMYSELNISFVNVPYFGVFDISWWFVPFATFVIVAFANAVNITDGLDGLAGGTSLITLIAFWVISASILDTPLLVFIGVLAGGLTAFLYFNIHPARLWMGDTGALSLGATLAVIGLLSGKVFALAIIGGVFVVEIASSLLQLLSKKFRGKKIFPVAPLHLWLQLRGWPEPKIVMRAWVAALLFAMFGLMIALMK